MLRKKHRISFTCLCLLLCAALLSATPISAAGEDVSPEDLILRQAVSLNGDIANIDDYEIVSAAVPNSISPFARSNTSNEAVLQKTEQVGAETIVTTIVPYKVNENDELENSFAYITRMEDYPTGTPLPLVLNDINITFRAYYEDPGLALYSPTRLEASWTSTASDVSIVNLTLNFDTRGELHDIAYANGGVYEQTLIQENYLHRIRIEVANPIKGRVYSASNSLPSNRILFLNGNPEYFYGGFVEGFVSYRINGELKMADGGFYNVFGVD